MKKWWVVPFVFAGGLAFLASAFCPVCAAGAVVGLGISRYLGVDDTVTGVWIGGILVLLSVWTIAWLKKRFTTKFADWWPSVVFFIYYLVVLAPLWWLGKIGHPLNRLWGMDKFILGIAVGTIIILLAMKLHYFLKTRNNGKSYFLMQRTVFNLVGLLLAAAAFYFLTGK